MNIQIIKLNKLNFWRLNFFEIYYQLFLLFLGAVTLFLIILVKSKTATEFWTDPLLFFYTIFVTTFQLSRVVGAMFYKYSMSKITVNCCGGGHYEPLVTFVIPCKNEEKAIAKTIEKCFEADYPKEKIEVIVINDGSTDNTVGVLNETKKKFKELIVVDWKINKGKRHGMAEGFKKAKGDIIIQLDSDSYIDPKTFSNLIKPFQNLEIGAVCAHADPENADENLLTKMQAAYYFMSFRILKAAESTFMSVFCCSGCSSAYRKSAVMPILDEWLNETFLGLPVTYGDDRALTSWLLKNDWKTIYMDKAQAYTIVPEKIKQLLKQQLRWKKSWIINFFKTIKFLYKKQPFIALTYFIPLFIISILAPFMAFKALIYSTFIYQSLPVYYIIGIFTVTSLIVIYYRLLSRTNKYWAYLFLWSVFNMIILVYVIVYAAIRIQDRGWGTR